ncbi:cytochrome d ubiquinol oxidase subunit II [Geminicoccaceae bacterium 1502E]|nr:cytochrome d ubiquinol oxidase subunit II [Geminicoccaceae bacterium 1502E]
MSIDLSLVWAAIIAFGVIMYVVMDGFDLGLGILFPFAASEGHRDVMMNTVAPVWDGNETWLVLGGAAMLGAFPMAYAVLLSAFYLPLILMLLALIFRGVAFEFRWKTRRNRHWWNRAFTWGSVVATFFQGVVLGAFVQGVDVENGAFAGGSFDWLTPFSLLTGLALVAGYAMLGAGWLILKSTGPLQVWAFGLMRPLLLAVLVSVGIVSLWTPFLHPGIAERWFSFPNILWLSPVPLLVLVMTVALWRSIDERSERAPFLLTLGLFLLSYAGLGISLWPHIIPVETTIWQAAAPPESQSFMLVGTVVLLPLILGYTAWSYWVFRGKVTEDQGYH